MKIYAYAVREDEVPFIKKIEADYDVEVIIDHNQPSIDQVSNLKGCSGVTILGQTEINKELLDLWNEQGIKYISTRTIGSNHIDVNYAKKLGMSVCHASYPPEGVAEFSLMLMLLCLRNFKPSLWRSQVNDYSLNGLQGRELHSLTVGVMGTGRIGKTLIRMLHGFGCKILAYDVYQSDEVKEMAEYVDLDRLYKESDIISLHLPLLDNTYHIINDYSINKMKSGMIIINCARGELCDSQALIRGIESGKLGGLGLDVIEGEEGIIHVNHRDSILSNRDMAYLHQFPNVILTQHFAFYTDIAVESMAECGIIGILEMAKKGSYPTQL